MSNYVRGIQVHLSLIVFKAHTQKLLCHHKLIDRGSMQINSLVSEGVHDHQSTSTSMWYRLEKRTTS
jgi:hypothetical protein